MSVAAIPVKHAIMVLNYVKTTYRNLLKHKTYAFINIFGLALSMGVCLFILLLIKDAYNYDKFHPDGQRVYRILTEAVRKSGGTESYASSPYLVGKALTENYSPVELWTPLVRLFGREVISNGQSYELEGLLSDKSFFDMFGFELALGNPEAALEEPYSLVLTADQAERMFNKEDPIGKVVEIPGYASNFKITGVLKPFAGKTHLQFTGLGSLATQIARENLSNGENSITNDWRNYYSNYSFVRLKDQAKLEAVKLALQDISKNQYADLELESRDAGYNFRLQPLGSITPGIILSNNMGQGMPIFLIWLFSALALIVIFSACFNYTNLSIARSLIRTKEIGVRKVLGASRGQVIRQFLGESVFVALVALVPAYFLMKLVKPQFQRLSFTEFLDVRLQEDWSLYGWFMLFTLFVGLIAGALPALTLSRTKPLVVLQKLQNIKLFQKLGLRKALLVTQFTLTLIFLILLTVSIRQANHAIVTNFGFDKPHTLLLELQGQSYERVSTAMAQVNGVQKISAISLPMGTWRDGSDDVRTDIGQEKVGVRQYHIDHEYLDHFNIKLVAGENFPNNPAQQQELFTIVNETFVQRFKLGTPSEAIGKSIIVADSTNLVIRGVVVDFPFKPAVYQMEPLLLRYDPEEFQMLNLEVSATNPATVVTAIERTWKQLDPDHDFQAQFFDETVRENYANMLDITSIVGFFGILGMVIACMGLLVLCALSNG